MKNICPPPRVFHWIVVLPIMYGCDYNELKKLAPEQPNLTHEEIKRLVLLATGYVYPVDLAKKQAVDLANQFLNKDGIKRTVSNFLTVPSLYSITGKTQIKTNSTISKPKTPSMYVANFNDKHGFVVLSADKRASEIIAIVGSGTIDSSANPGLRVYLSNAVQHIDEKVAEMESYRGDADFESLVKKLEKNLDSKKTSRYGRTSSAPCNALRVSVPGRISSADCPVCYYITSTTPIQSVNTTTYIAQPLTPLWNQGPPYNNGQPDGGCLTYSIDCNLLNSKFPAGCVAIAEAQVVAYFNAKKYANWQGIVNKSCAAYTSIEANTVASLAHNIYLDYGIWVSRSCNSTGAGATIGDIHLTNPRGISPSYGLVQGEWRDWNTGHIRNSLINQSPVVIEGQLNLCCFIYCWGCGGGHEWVIDGMRDLGVQTTYRYMAYYSGTDCTQDEINQGVTTYTYTTNTTTATQIHQNWGWGVGMGSDPNDWYEQDVFETNASHSGDANFNHANYIVAYITAK